MYRYGGKRCNDAGLAHPQGFVVESHLLLPSAAPTRGYHFTLAGLGRAKCSACPERNSLLVSGGSVFSHIELVTL